MLLKKQKRFKICIQNFLFTEDRILTTEDDLTYQFEPMYGEAFFFKVSCGNDAHIALTSGAEETSPMYQIYIGGWENQHSGIRPHVEGKKFFCK